MDTHHIRRLLAGVLTAGMVAVSAPAFADPGRTAPRAPEVSASAQQGSGALALTVNGRHDDDVTALLGSPEALQAAEEALKDPRVRAEAARVLAAMSTPIPVRR